MRNGIILSAFVLLAATSASAQPAAAPQAGPSLTVGTPVFDPTGAEIGTIDSVTAEAVVVSTGTNKVAIPPSSFGAGPKGPLLSATRADLDAAAEKAAADTNARLTASLVPGAEVRGMSGQNVVGSVKALEGGLVRVTTPDGDVKVPLSSLSLGPNGLIIGMSASEFEAAVAASKSGE